MADSINLRHLPERDPASTTIKTAERTELQRRVDEYLATGGVIQDVGNQSGMIYTKRTRKAQVNFIRKRDYRRRTE